MQKQKGFYYPLLALPTIAFLVIAGVGWNVYQENNSQSNREQSSQPTPQNSNTEATSQGNADEVATAPDSTRPENTSNKKSSSGNQTSSAERYLEIKEWKIKIKYTAKGDYKLTYNPISDDAFYLSTNELAKFAQKHPECSDADIGTVLNRIKPGGYDYRGEQWSEDKLISVQAVKVHGYYYVKFPYFSCSTSTDGVSFEAQQEYISLSQKIPWHDAVSSL